MADAQDLCKGVTAFADLPLADEGTAWDGSAAAGRVAKWASSDGTGNKDTIDWAKYRKAFVWYDSAAPDALGSYKLGVGDVIDGSLKAVPAAVYAIAARLNQTDISAEDKIGVQAHLKKYYEKLKKPAPWDPATGTVTKNDDGIVATLPIMKADTAQRVLYGGVLYPDMVDLQGDVIKAPAIAATAHEFLAGYNLSNDLGVMHQALPPGLLLWESWIVGALDGKQIDLGDGKVIPVGTWMIAVKVLDDAIWARVVSGELKGFSIAGVARKAKMLTEGVDNAAG